jgi:hypothetical protein
MVLFVTKYRVLWIVLKKIPYFAVSTNPKNANDSSQNYPIYFNEQGYEALNLHINSNNYSTVFNSSGHNTNEFCLPTFLPYIETDLTIEIIEFEAGEENKTLTCVQIWNVLTELGDESYY